MFSQILIPSFSLCFYVFLVQLVPRWYEHWTSNLVYDGDMIVLQGQEKIFLAASKESSADVNQQYTKITFTPTQADRFVLAFRTWLRKFGNSQPKWFGNPSQEALPSTVLSKREVKVTMVTKGSQYYFFFCSRLNMAIFLSVKVSRITVKKKVSRICFACVVNTLH